MTTPEERLQRLEDRDAIHQLFIDYGRYLDAGDFDAYHIISSPAVKFDGDEAGYKPNWCITALLPFRRIPGP